MAKSPQLHKVAKKHSINKRQRWVIAGILTIVVLSLGLWIFRNTSVYSINIDNPKTQMSALLAKIQPASSSLLYSAIIDNGCSDSHSVGLSRRIDCSLAGYKYYKSTSDIKADLLSIDATLTANGWKRESISSDHTADQAFDGTHQGSIFYLPTDRSLRTSLSLEVDDSKMQNIPKSVYQIGKIDALSREERLFGIHVSQTYWACNEDSIFQLPCFPPSGLKN